MSFKPFSLCVVSALVLACSSGGSVGQPTSPTADATNGADGQGTLADGWQGQADATPPDDSWTWNDAAEVWQQADTGGPDALADGWQGQADATPPDDAWTWNDVAEVWQQPDAAAPDAAPGDAIAQPDGKLPPPEPGAPGAACDAHSECDTGFCAGLGSGFGYCSIVGCKSSADCAFASDVPVCCMQYGLQKYCLKQWGAEGTCGVQDKKPGEGCLSGGQSDCATGSWCFKQGAQAQCVASCSAGNQSCPAGTKCMVFENGGGCLPYTPGVPDGAPCAGKNIGGCGEQAWCIENYPGDPLAYCASSCTADSQCGAGYACSTWGPGPGICLKYGSKQAGQNCADDRFSCAKGLLCVGGAQAAAVCSPQCTVDANCDTLGKALFGEAYCAKGPGSPVGVCYPKGSAQNGENCADNPYVCAQGSFCVNGYDVYDPDAYCMKSCGPNTDGTCPAGSSCVPYSQTFSGCQIDGAKGQGESCAGAPTTCKTGHLCLGAQGKEICVLQCQLGVGKPNGGCPSDAWCAPWGANTSGGGGYGACMPFSNLDVGEKCGTNPWGCVPGSFCQQWGQAKDAVCIQKCGAGDSCPNGTSCKDFGQAGKYCQPTGGKTQDESCTTDANACAPGHVCLSPNTASAICSKQCKSSADCAAGHWCSLGQWGGYCLPDGDIPKNGLCFGKEWGCDAGLLCLGDADSNPGAFCAQECSGFASKCAAGEKCEYLGNGHAWCVQTGTLPHGSVCLQEPLACDPSTLCIKGTPQSLCLQTCGVGKPACPADSPCTPIPFTALKLCVPKGFTPFGALRVPF